MLTNESLLHFCLTYFSSSFPLFFFSIFKLYRRMYLSSMFYPHSIDRFEFYKRFGRQCSFFFRVKWTLSYDIAIGRGMTNYYCVLLWWHRLYAKPGLLRMLRNILCIQQKITLNNNKKNEEKNYRTNYEYQSYFYRSSWSFNICMCYPI